MKDAQGPPSLMTSSNDRQCPTLSHRQIHRRTTGHTRHAGGQQLAQAQIFSTSISSRSTHLEFCCRFAVYRTRLTTGTRYYPEVSDSNLLKRKKTSPPVTHAPVAQISVFCSFVSGVRKPAQDRRTDGRTNGEHKRVICLHNKLITANDRSALD